MGVVEWRVRGGRVDGRGGGVESEGWKIKGGGVESEGDGVGVKGGE